MEDTVHLGGLTHFHLLNHERVFKHLERFLGRPSPALPHKVAGVAPVDP